MPMHVYKPPALSAGRPAPPGLRQGRYQVSSHGQNHDLILYDNLLWLSQPLKSSIRIPFWAWWLTLAL